MPRKPATGAKKSAQLFIRVEPELIERLDRQAERLAKQMPERAPTHDLLHFPLRMLRALAEAI